MILAQKTRPARQTLRVARDEVLRTTFGRGGRWPAGEKARFDGGTGCSVEAREADAEWSLGGLRSQVADPQTVNAPSGAGACASDHRHHVLWAVGWGMNSLGVSRNTDFASCGMHQRCCV